MSPAIKHEASRNVRALRSQGGLRTETGELLAEETPVALVYNDQPYAVMMATPADLDDFAVGFSLTEGIVGDARKIQIIDRLATQDGFSLELLIPQAEADALQSRQRNLTGRTGCGLCGAASLATAIRPVRQVTAEGRLTEAHLFACFSELEHQQALNRSTGAVHAAAVLLANGAIVVREDVGRHNAIDKVFGAAARGNQSVRALLVTSRASYEVVHKAAQVGCPIVAAISAPTALAVRIAIEAGVTLAGFTRSPRLTVYSHPGRLAISR